MAKHPKLNTPYKDKPRSVTGEQGVATPSAKSVTGHVPGPSAGEDIVRKARDKMIKRQVKGNKPKLPSMY